MALPFKPEPKVVIAELQVLLALIHYGIERSVLEAALTLQSRGLPFEPTAHATLFRLHLKQFMLCHGQDAQVGDLANCGVLIVVPGYELRVLKSTSAGGPPAPGDSNTLLRFYNQIAQWQPRLPILADWFPESRYQRPPLHLVTHWFASSTGQFIRAKVACPQFATRSVASWYFNEALPNPVVHLIQPPTVERAPSRLSDDLGFEPRELPLTGDELPRPDQTGDDLLQ
jgi:hypothetical protein